jgi:hypothetical protein
MLHLPLTQPCTLKRGMMNGLGPRRSHAQEADLWIEHHTISHAGEEKWALQEVGQLILHLQEPPHRMGCLT